MLRMCGAVTVSISVVLGRKYGTYEFPWTRCVGQLALCWDS